MIFDVHKHNEEPVKMEFYALGTILQLTAYGKNAEKACAEAKILLLDIDNRMSVFIDNSEVSKINKNAGKLPVKVGSDTYYVIKKALEYSKLSSGAFNPTIRPVMCLWGINTDHACVPSRDEIKTSTDLVNYNDIVLDEIRHTVMLRNENQALDLGGIAKGFAADKVKRIFLRNNIESALINLGGNIYTLHEKPDGTLWSIGIQNPLKARGEFVGVVCVKNKSVVTSGDYERFFISKGKKFHHIMNPLTGTPVENGMISATIISDHSIDGDALSTCVFVMGFQEGMKFIETLKGIQAIFITDKKNIYTTINLDEYFYITNKDYKVCKVPLNEQTSDFESTDEQH